MSVPQKSSNRFAAIALILSLVALLITLIHVSLFLVYTHVQSKQAPLDESRSLAPTLDMSSEEYETIEDPILKALRNNEPLPSEKESAPEDSETFISQAEKIFLQALKHIANREAKEAAKYIHYPLVRPYPLPAIENEEAFVRAFSTLFDDDTLNQIAQNLAEGERPDLVGWRGYCYLNGGLWGKGDYYDEHMQHHVGGKIYVIQCDSSIEDALVAEAKNKEVASLHPELRTSIADPIFSFVSDDQAYYGRID